MCKCKWPKHNPSSAAKSFTPSHSPVTPVVSAPVFPFSRAVVVTPLPAELIPPTTVVLVIAVCHDSNCANYAKRLQRHKRNSSILVPTHATANAPLIYFVPKVSKRSQRESDIIFSIEVSQRISFTFDVRISISTVTL